MKKFVFIIPQKDFRDAELLEPKRILEKAGIEVKIAAPKKGVAVGADGAQVEATIEVANIDESDYNGVAFIGGPGTAPMIDDEIFKDAARKFFEANKITTAICVAPAILANAEILNGKIATAWEGAKRVLIEKGALWSDDPVVTDGNIITANGPASAIQFGKAIAEILISK